MIVLKYLKYWTACVGKFLILPFVNIVRLFVHEKDEIIDITWAESALGGMIVAGFALIAFALGFGGIATVIGYVIYAVAVTHIVVIAALAALLLLTILILLLTVVFRHVYAGLGFIGAMLLLLIAYVCGGVGLVSDMIEKLVYEPEVKA